MVSESNLPFTITKESQCDLYSCRTQQNNSDKGVNTNEYKNIVDFLDLFEQACCVSPSY